MANPPRKPGKMRKLNDAEKKDPRKIKDGDVTNHLANQAADNAARSQRNGRKQAADTWLHVANEFRRGSN